MESKRHYKVNEKVNRSLRLGFVLNPVAGAGGPAALKGSDAADTREAVYAGKLISPAAARARVFFDSLQSCTHQLVVYCVPGAMGSEVLQNTGLNFELIDCEVKKQSDGDDTRAVCEVFCQLGVDLLVFAGGDGTARDVYDAVEDRLPCLGIPSGVKMQSAVFGIHPHASAGVIVALLAGEGVQVELREVRDIDEKALQKGEVKSRHYGDLKVPIKDNLVQQVKHGSGHLDEFVVLDIADELRERLQELANDVLLIFGPGSTTFAVQRELGFSGSLLGVDVVSQNERYLDLSEEALFQLLAKNPQRPRRLILTIIGGQGHVLGRGNQQLSARILNLIGRENIWLIAAPHKLQELVGRPLLIDSGDVELDVEWQGLIEVITGYQKISLYRVT